MASQIQKSKSTQKREAVLDETQPKKADEELKAALDDLLDEIDSVLEENAEEFVKAYVQKGGE